MSQYKEYAKQLRKQFNYRATWLPGVEMTVGDVGTLENGVFRRETSLSNLGIQFAPKIDKFSDEVVKVQSESGVKVTFKLAGKANNAFKFLTRAEAGARVEFAGEDAMVMELADVVLDRIEDVSALKSRMLSRVVDRHPDRTWERNWVVVTEVLRAGAGTVLISSSQAAEIELRATGKVPPANLVDVEAALETATSSNVSTEIVSSKDLTPMYLGLRVSRNFWWLYDEVRIAEVPPNPEEVWVVAQPEEDEDAREAE